MSNAAAAHADLEKNELNAWANAYEKENGYAPKRSEKKNQKELIERKLKKRAV